MVAGILKYACVDCKINKRYMQGTLLCKECFYHMSNRLKLVVRNIETNREDRLSFLVERCELLGLKHTKADIKQMIADEYTDEMILRTKKLAIRIGD